MKRPGFTAIELLLTLGIITLSAGMAVPMYRQYLIRSDLEIARQNIAQGIERAKFLSQIAMNDSGWGFTTEASPDRGVLFMGDSYATRNEDFDEVYSISNTISTVGSDLTEVSFSKIEGLPDTTGSILLTALNGEQRTITVNIGNDGTVSIPDDWMDICVDPWGANPQTISVPDSLWEYYEDNGAIMGECGEGESSSAPGGGGGETVDFLLDGDAVVPQVDYTCIFEAIGSSAEGIPMTLQVKFGGAWVNPFGTWTQAVTANLNDGEEHVYYCTDTYTAGTTIDLRAQSWKKKKNWLSGESNSDWATNMMKNTQSFDNDNIWSLKNADTVPSAGGMVDQADVEEFVDAYIDISTRTINLDSDKILVFFELGTNNLSSTDANFQDLVILITLIEM